MKAQSKTVYSIGNGRIVVNRHFSQRDSIENCVLSLMKVRKEKENSMADTRQKERQA